MSSKVHAHVALRGHIDLDEQQLRALDALVGYGFKPFIEVFHEKLGKAYMEKHAAGLERLFETIRRDVPPALRRIDTAREALDPRYQVTLKPVKQEEPLS